MKMLEVVLVALMVSAPALAQQPPAATPAALPSVVLPPELDRVLRDYEKAWQARDPQALAELFAEDGFVLENGHGPVRGREAIRMVYSGSGGPLSLRALAYSTSGNVGYIIGGYGPAPAAPDSGKFVLTLRRSGSRWLIMSDMDNANQRRQQQPCPAASTVTPTFSALN